MSATWTASGHPTSKVWTNEKRADSEGVTGYGGGRTLGVVMILEL